jgi:hypothetical protein
MMYYFVLGKYTEEVTTGATEEVVQVYKVAEDGVA